mgnify:CR=1 FL=1
MIIKAVVCVAAVWMFLPHEPNLGVDISANVPQASSIMTSVACAAIGKLGVPCLPASAPAKAEPTSIEQVRVSFLDRIHDVKDELRAARR